MKKIAILITVIMLPLLLMSQGNQYGSFIVKGDLQVNKKIKVKSDTIVTDLDTVVISQLLQGSDLGGYVTLAELIYNLNTKIDTSEITNLNGFVKCGNSVLSTATASDVVNNFYDTARAWTDTLKFDRINVFYEQSTSVDTLKTNPTIKIKSVGALIGSCEYKEWVGDGTHEPVLSALKITSGYYDKTLGVRNRLTFFKAKNNRYLVTITQDQ